MGNALQSYAHKKPALNARPLVLVRLRTFYGFNRLVLGQAPSEVEGNFYFQLVVEVSGTLCVKKEMELL